MKMFGKFAGILAFAATVHAPSALAQSALEMDRESLAKAYQLNDGEALVIYQKSGCAVVYDKTAPSTETVAAVAGGSSIRCVTGLADGFDSCGDQFDMGLPLPAADGRRYLNNDELPDSCERKIKREASSSSNEPPMYHYQLSNSDVSVSIIANQRLVSDALMLPQVYNFATVGISQKMAYLSIRNKAENEEHRFSIFSTACDKNFTNFQRGYDQNGRSGEYFRKAAELCAKLELAEEVATVHSVNYIHYSGESTPYTELAQRRTLCALTGKIEAAAVKAGLGNECAQVWGQIIGPFLPQVNAAWQQTRERESLRVARVADLRQNFATRYDAELQRMAQKEQNAKQEYTQKLAVQSQQRIENFRNANPKLFVGNTVAAGIFQKPVSGADAYVLLVGDNGGGPMSLFVDRSVLQDNDVHQIEEVGGLYDKEAFDAAIARAKTSGAKTLYLVYLDRAFAWEGPVSATPEKIFATFKKSPEANPQYANCVAELKTARAQLAATQGDYDRTYSTAVRKGESGDIQGAAMGIITSLGASSDLTRAERRVAELEEILARTDQTITETEWFSFDGVKTKYRLEYNAPLVIYACDFAKGLCAEKERPVTGAVTADRYPVYFPRASQDTYKFAERDAQKLLYGTVDKKRAFGLTADAIGTFADGGKLQIPMAALASYIAYADNDAKKQFKALMAPNEEAFTKIAPQLVATGDKASAQNYVDVGGMIAAARKRITRTELQGL